MSRPRSDLHLLQARHALDPDKALALARLFASGRIYNARRLIQRLRSRLSAEEVARKNKLNDVIDKLDYYRRTAELAPRIDAIDEVRGIEGRAAAVYWPALSGMLHRGFAEEHFKRTRQPAQSAFNALLNWTAYLLRRDIETLVVRRGLHPGFGVLHAADDRRDGLVFDLMEIFRAPVAEALAVGLLSTGTLNHAHFELLTIGGEEGIRMVNGAAAKAIRAYERHADRRVKDPERGEFTTWRGLMDSQISAYIRHLEGRDPFVPYRMDM